MDTQRSTSRVSGNVQGHPLALYYQACNLITFIWLKSTLFRGSFSLAVSYKCGKEDGARNMYYILKELLKSADMVARNILVIAGALWA